MKNFKTPQEKFWAGSFGRDYISRNKSSDLLASNLHFFSIALDKTQSINSCLEFGANIGMNLKALHLLFPSMDLRGIEINKPAANELIQLIGKDHVYNGSIFDYEVSETSELSLIKGVLIHINPKMLNIAYEKIYESSSKYILIAEYYNPSPLTVAYRGHDERLFKRDFAGELMNKYPDLHLLDYGFVYRRDPKYPQDDITWFLLEK